MTGVGVSPEDVGVTFSLGSGERSKPVVVENGVVMIEMVNLTIAPEVADYTVYSDQIKQQLSGKTPFNITSAIKEFADIEDERYKFY